jgi:hypothetical protein
MDSEYDSHSPSGNRAFDSVGSDLSWHRTRLAPYR